MLPYSCFVWVILIPEHQRIRNGVSFFKLLPLNYIVTNYLPVFPIGFNYVGRVKKGRLVPDKVGNGE